MLREPQTHQLAALHDVLVAKLEAKDPRLSSIALHAPRRLEEANEQVLDSRLLSQIPGIPAGLRRQAHVDTALQKHKIRARTHTHTCTITKWRMNAGSITRQRIALKSTRLLLSMIIKAEEQKQKRVEDKAKI